MDKRPDLNKNITVKDFQDFYWLKSELVDFCRSEGLSTTGSKIEIAQRISHYLQTGEKQKPQKSRPIATFDWNTEALTLSTVITDNYKSSENVRVFFKQHLGENFKFNVPFMDWMKANVGKTLGDAISQYAEIVTQRKSTPHKKIAPQFEYNTYLRDFLKDNPGSSRSVGIKLWKIKRSMRGDNVYSRKDLEFLD